MLVPDAWFMSRSSAGVIFIMPGMCM
jgi:hypothetical protein